MVQWHSKGKLSMLYPKLLLHATFSNAIQCLIARQRCHIYLEYFGKIRLLINSRSLNLLWQLLRLLMQSIRITLLWRVLNVSPTAVSWNFTHYSADHFIVFEGIDVKSLQHLLWLQNLLVLFVICVTSMHKCITYLDKSSIIGHHFLTWNYKFPASLLSEFKHRSCRKMVEHKVQRTAFPNKIEIKLNPQKGNCFTASRSQK